MRLCCRVFELVRSHIPSLAQHLPIHLDPQSSHSGPSQTWPQTHLGDRHGAPSAVVVWHASIGSHLNIANAMDNFEYSTPAQSLLRECPSAQYDLQALTGKDTWLWPNKLCMWQSVGLPSQHHA